MNAEEEGPLTAQGDPGTCGFCGIGGGYLGQQGDETTQYLSATIKNDDGTFSQHPNRLPGWSSYITWCGRCVGGLKHKYQRYDDTNLRAKLVSTKLRREMDGLRFSAWGLREEDIDENVLNEIADDPGVHLEKLKTYDEISDMHNEQLRRAGVDLTTEGWRP